MSGLPVESRTVELTRSRRTTGRRGRTATAPGRVGFPGRRVVGGAAVLMEEVAVTTISDENPRFSRLALRGLRSNFERVSKIVELLRPQAAKENNAFSGKR